MTDFASMAAAESWLRTRIKNGTFINGHVCRATTGGKIAVRVQKPMSPSDPDAGGWEEITDDA